MWSSCEKLEIDHAQMWISLYIKRPYDIKETILKEQKVSCLIALQVAQVLDEMVYPSRFQYSKIVNRSYA
jgi:hypothetical protein